jgi:signal transduction histidine kinase
MAEPADLPHLKLSALDPRRSLVAGATWLIVALVLVLSVVAAVAVGRIARETVFEQHVRRLRLETDQLSSELGLSIQTRVDAVRAVGVLLHAPALPSAPVGEIFAALTQTFPQLDWLAVADTEGRIVAANGVLRAGMDVSDTPWFAAAGSLPWLGVIASADTSAATLGDLVLPVLDAGGRRLGVIVSRVSWRRPTPHFTRLTDEADPQMLTEAMVLDRDGHVLVGPTPMRGKPWSGVAMAGGQGQALEPQFERLPDGRALLVSRAPLGGELASLGWQVQLGEPTARVYLRADAVAIRILWISLGLGALTALIGVQAARRLTRRLHRLTLSVTQVGEDESAPLEVPTGVDEVARLGSAFARILGALREERRELERRVAVRTREVERLAAESRHASIVRERLQIARDLHDTLAHSMMAMLSEIRLMRRLHVRDPRSLGEELQRAEEVAHAGLIEARKAITQMRSNAVRDTGLGPALAAALDHFINRSGLTAEFVADPEAARFGDERGEIYLRIAQEALRNIERHAQATRVSVRLSIGSDARLVLSIIDDGVGFDPTRIAPGHFGLLGLREQAELIGGELRIESRPGHGTAIELAVSLAPVMFLASP